MKKSEVRKQNRPQTADGRQLRDAIGGLWTV